MAKFIDYKSLVSEKKGKYSFLIANTGDSDKEGTQWWSLLNIEPKTDIFFFDTFGVDELKSFIVQDDNKVIEKILFGTEKITRTNNKIALLNIKLNLNPGKNLPKKELDALSATANNLFILSKATSSNYVIF